MKIHLLLALAGTPIASAAAAQEIDYQTGEYEYAQPEAEIDNDVVTESSLAEPAAASYVLHGEESANSALPDQLILRQGPIPDASFYVAYPSLPANTSAAAPDEVIYAYPAPGSYTPAQSSVGSSRVIYRDARPAQMGYGRDYQPAYQQAPTLGHLPAGGQLVALDRTAWLDECRSRLDGYEESDRANVIGALMGDASERRRDDSTDSYGQCQTYLDEYIAGARANAGHAQYTQGGQYMLVPVTIATPQRAVYRDGTPAD